MASTTDYSSDAEHPAVEDHAGHGPGTEGYVDFDEYIELHDEIFGMMQELYNQIDNAAFTDAFRKT